MADSSPGKVQALRAIFSEQNRPVMGLIPPGGRIPGKPWMSLDSATKDSATSLKEKRLSSDVAVSRNKSPSKPVIGPKPAHLMTRVTSTESVDKVACATTRSAAANKAFGETIASFMFASSSNNKENEREQTPPPLPPNPKPRISQLQLQLQSDVETDFCKARNALVTSDNYICKSGCNIRRKPLPPLDKLGPPPPKPARPPFLVLPPCPPPKETVAVVLAPKPPLQRPPYPCPPRPATPPPLPPVSSPVIKPPTTSLREEIEELYEDTLLGENRRPVSLIPEYTAEEEQAELYNDAGDCSEENSSFSDYSYKYRRPPPLPSEYLQPNSATSTEELYQDADGVESDEVYEVMPCDDIPDDSGYPVYSNNKKEIEKLRKEEEKRIRKEQREKDKRQKELDKLRKKFGLTGEEIPIDDGLVKWDSRGGKGDLPVRKGETVLILRMEGNPSGRWLVKNEKGKIGYVELTNIEVDPLSVKSVMSIRRLSVMSAGEELYCEAKSEEEGIYEVTY